jgi:hypothetical protein
MVFSRPSQALGGLRLHESRIDVVQMNIISRYSGNSLTEVGK